MKGKDAVGQGGYCGTCKIKNKNLKNVFDTAEFFQEREVLYYKWKKLPCENSAIWSSNSIWKSVPLKLKGTQSSNGFKELKVQKDCLTEGIFEKLELYNQISTVNLESIIFTNRAMVFSLHLVLGIF